jgi:hypothetical protein
VKWRETLPSQEESAGRDIPMGQLVTKVLVSRESPLPPCQHWPGRNSPVPRRWEPGPFRCPHPRWTAADWVLWEPDKVSFFSDHTKFSPSFLEPEIGRLPPKIWDRTNFRTTFPTDYSQPPFPLSSTMF